MVPAVDVDVDVQRKDARAGLIGPHRRARAFDLDHRLLRTPTRLATPCTASPSIRPFPVVRFHFPGVLS